MIPSLPRSAGRLLLAALLLTTTAAFGAPASPAQEIDALLDRLAASGCDFERNGTWHPAAAARQHLAKKREAVARRGALQSAEQFIDLAASRSSMSGQPYHVRCPGKPVQESQQWLGDTLKALRAEGR